MLYYLLITDTELSDEGHSEDFFIGVFLTRAEAEDTARRYLAEVPGFCEYPCVFRVEEIPFLSSEAPREGQAVWQGEGWNIDEDFNETDIVRTPFCPARARAEAEMCLLQRRFPREQWACHDFRVGSTFWAEGFDRG